MQENRDAWCWMHKICISNTLEKLYNFKLSVILHLWSSYTTPTVRPKSRKATNHLSAKSKTNDKEKVLRKQCKACYEKGQRRESIYCCPQWRTNWLYVEWDSFINKSKYFMTWTIAVIIWMYLVRCKMWCKKNATVNMSLPWTYHQWKLILHVYVIIRYCCRQLIMHMHVMSHFEGFFDEN